MTTLAADLTTALPGLRASSSEADRVAYSRDLWPRHHLAVRAGHAPGDGPAAIVWPTRAEEVAAVVTYARRAGVPLVPFGAGSGVCGAVSPTRETIVVDLKRLGRIRRLDPAAPLVEVEAGHMGVPLDKALERAGFTLGHYPSSILCSTVGGWIAARSAGQCSGAYGKIEDMVVGLECVTGEGDLVQLRRRTSGVDLVPLVVGSEGTLAIVTSAELRLHPLPEARAFGSWSFPTTRHGWEAMRVLFQAGLRPAVARLYDPFDALVAKMGARQKDRSEKQDPAPPGSGGALLRRVLARPRLMNELLDSRAAAWALGGAMLLVVFEGEGASIADALQRARALLESRTGRATWSGEAPARRWLLHRYAVSYRQAPVFARGAFVDTMEVAAPWSRLEALYDGVRRALGEHVFVMAHLSHAYPDGCCIYFSFAGAATPSREVSWDDACTETYDRAWQAALKAATEAGGTIAHHHGVGRSKAPQMRAELGSGVEIVRALMKAFDPASILNPGNLLPPPSQSPSHSHSPSPSPVLDRPSLLVDVHGKTDLAWLEGWLRSSGLTLDVLLPSSPTTVAMWLAQGAPGSRDRWLDPADQLLAGLRATVGHRLVEVRPSPRRSVGPDLTALFVGAGDRFGTILGATLRVHLLGTVRPTSPPFHHDRDPPLAAGERGLVDTIARSLGLGG